MLKTIKENNLIIYNVKNKYSTIMEKIDRILHDLDQGNANVTDTKKLVLDLFSVMLSDIVEEGERGALYMDDGKSGHSLGNSQGFESGINYVLDEFKEKIHSA